MCRKPWPWVVAHYFVKLTMLSCIFPVSYFLSLVLGLFLMHVANRHAISNWERWIKGHAMIALRT